MKKWISLLLTLILMISMTGCVGDVYENVATINGEEISSGLYLMMQYIAYTEAEAELGVTDGNFSNHEIEGQKADDWIAAEVEKNLRRYVAVRELARENDMVEIDAAGQESVNQLMEYWPYLEEMYWDNGISQDTVLRAYTSEELARMVFEKMYSEGGEMEVPQDELQAEYAEKYAHINVISVPTTSEDGTTDVQEELLAEMDKLVELLEDGKTLEEVAAEDIAPLYDMLGRDTYNEDAGLDNIYDSYIKYDQEDFEVYTEEFLHYLKGLEVGEFGAYNMGSTVILYEVIPTFVDQEEYDSMFSTILSQLRSEEYEAYLESIYSQYEVEWKFGARWYHSISKIV